MTWDYERVACVGGPEDGRVVSIAKSIHVVTFPHRRELDEIGAPLDGPEPPNRKLQFFVYRKTVLRSGETVLVHDP